MLEPDQEGSRNRRRECGGKADGRGPYRTGGQAQFIEQWVPDGRHSDNFQEVLDWAPAHLDHELSIEAMAARTYLSRRSFARRFRAATGTTPYAWVVEQRIRLAQQMLEEEPGLTLSVIARRAGFGSANVLRQQFQKRFGCSPSNYRAHFVNRYVAQVS